MLVDFNEVPEPPVTINAPPEVEVRLPEPVDEGEPAILTHLAPSL
jgi:hypothetical protein